jgi:hypothetical protein
MEVREKFAIGKLFEQKPAKEVLNNNNKKPVIQEQEDIIEKLLSGNSVTKKIDTCYGEFEFRYPSGSDSINIARRRSEYMGDHPQDTFDSGMLYQFQKWATLDVLVSKVPEKFKNVSTWADFPDQETADEVFNTGITFCSEIRGKIKNNRSGEFKAADESEDA